MDAGKADMPRIMLVDEDRHLHDEFRRALFPAGPGGGLRHGLRNLAGKLLHRASGDAASPSYELAVFFKQEDAFEEVRRSVAAGDRFAILFIDEKLLPGEGEADFGASIAGADNLINIVVMITGPAPQAVPEQGRLETADNLFYIDKGVAIGESRLIALLLSAKWRAETAAERDNTRLAGALENSETFLAARALELQRAGADLVRLEEALREKEEQLGRQAGELEESAIAMKVMLANLASENSGLDQKVLARKVGEIDERIVINARELTEPVLDKLEMTSLTGRQKEYLAILRENLHEITSPAMQRLYSADFGLTPAELQVANLVRQGKSSKDIAAVLNLSVRTIEFHRDRIRKKLGIKARRTSLKSVLDSFRGPVGPAG